MTEVIAPNCGKLRQKNFGRLAGQRCRAAGLESCAAAQACQHKISKSACGSPFCSSCKFCQTDLRVAPYNTL
jgi:hypothetical protein